MARLGIHTKLCEKIGIRHTQVSAIEKSLATEYVALLFRGFGLELLHHAEVLMQDYMTVHDDIARELGLQVDAKFDGTTGCRVDVSASATFDLNTGV